MRIFRCRAALVAGCAALLSLPGLRAAEAPQAAPKAAGPDRSARPDFWSAQFNSPGSFDNLGIDTFRHHTFVSRKLRFKGAAETEVGYTVYLPPGYDRSEARYPIIYFLIGNGGTENRASVVVGKAHAAMVKGELPPFIIAGTTGGRSFYGNQFEGRCQVHDFFLEEFVPHIEKNYRIKPEARYRHLQGMSAGGNGAFLFGLKRPDLFGTVVAIAGAFYGVRVNAWAQMYGASEANYRPYDPFVLVQANKARVKNLRIGMWVGSQDTTIRDNTAMHRLLNELSVAHVYNDWNAQPKLEGVTHNFPRYYELVGDEILQFHAQAFRD